MNRKTTSMKLLTVVRKYLEYEAARWHCSLATAYNRVVMESAGFLTWQDNGEVMRLRREVEKMYQINDAMRTRMEAMIDDKS